MLSKAAGGWRIARDTPMMRADSLQYIDIPQNKTQDTHIVFELIHNGGYRLHHQSNDIPERNLLEKLIKFTKILDVASQR